MTRVARTRRPRPVPAEPGKVPRSKRRRPSKGGPPVRDRFEHRPPADAPAEVVQRASRPPRAKPNYYLTVGQIQEQLSALERQYPGLARVEDIGDSWEKSIGEPGHDLFALHLGKPARDGEHKPKVLFVAGMHAREVANPVFLMRWAQQQLAGHGRDAEATALLDDHEIVLVFVANPDGRALVDRGYETGNRKELFQRRNTHRFPQLPEALGVDLNRNFDSQWGTAGASHTPRSDTFCGWSAASEPETQAMQALLHRLRPDLFVDLHSYSGLVLYPWGFTEKPCPDAAGLGAVAQRFAEITGYEPMQSVGLYPTSGTSIDYAYEKLGIPAFCVETGDRFHMDDAEFEKTWDVVGPLLSYATKIAGDAYHLARGPKTADVAVGPEREVAATLANPDGAAIVAAEVVLDPAAPAGSGVPLQPADGAFDSASEKVLGVLPQTAPDATLAYVRGEDADGHWGPATAQWINKPG